MLAVHIPPERPPAPLPALADHLEMTLRHDLLPSDHVASLPEMFPTVFPTRRCTANLREHQNGEIRRSRCIRPRATRELRQVADGPARRAPHVAGGGASADLSARVHSSGGESEPDALTATGDENVAMARIGCVMSTMVVRCCHVNMSLDWSPNAESAQQDRNRALDGLEARQRYGYGRRRAGDHGRGRPLDPRLPVLARLVELGDGRLRQQELAQLLGWERSRLSRQISRMADRRLVIRERSGSARLISATEHGRAAVTAARPAHAVAVRRVLLDQIAPSPQPISGTRSRRSALTTIPAPTTATDHQSRRRSTSLRAVGHLADPEPRRARPSHCDRGARGALGRKAGVGAFGRVALLAAELQGGRRGGADRSDMYASRRRRGPTARLIWAPAQALRGPR